MLFCSIRVSHDERYDFPASFTFLIGTSLLDLAFSLGVYLGDLLSGSDISLGISFIVSSLGMPWYGCVLHPRRFHAEFSVSNQGELFHGSLLLW